MINSKELRGQVKGIFHHYPATKESDEKLISTLWSIEACRIYGTQDLAEVTAKELFVLLWKGKLTSPESIMRTRRKLQEEFPELRGKNYEARHKRVKVVKSKLGYHHD
jgi:hypothetical protein